MTDWRVRQAQDRAWGDYKKKHPIKAVLWNVFCVVAIIAILVGVIAGPKLFAWWDCGQVCDARGHDNFYRISQGCYCLDDEGKPYNPKDER
jgi:hypothetical protein